MVVLPCWGLTNVIINVTSFVFQALSSCLLLPGDATVISSSWDNNVYVSVRASLSFHSHVTASGTPSSKDSLPLAGHLFSKRNTYWMRVKLLGLNVII